MALVILSGTFPVIPAVVLAVNVIPSSPVMVRSPLEVDQVAAALEVKVKATPEPPATVNAPPAGPVILAAPLASTKVKSPTLETCKESVPSPTSKGADGEVSPMPTFPPAKVAA